MTEPKAPLERREDAATAPGHPFAKALRSIAHELAEHDYPRGRLAALRRMDPDRPGRVAALHALLAECDVPEHIYRDSDMLARWALIVHGMALMVPDHHRARDANGKPVPVGASLCGEHGLEQAIIKEQRLAQLLNARGPTFRALIPRICRHLKARNCALDWLELAWLVLHEGRNEAPAEAARLRIARAYYRAAQQRSGFESGPSEKEQAA